jgi:hypothetical protein
MASTTTQNNLAALLRDRMRAQADLFAALTSHPTLVGSGREGALAEVLRQLVPRRFEVLSGTIALTDGSGQPRRTSHQLDIMVVDTFDYPTLLRVGDTAVVLPPAVRAIIEVKSDLQAGEKFVEAFTQTCRAQHLLGTTTPVFTTLYCFGAPSRHKTLRGWLEALLVHRQKLRTKVKNGRKHKKLYLAQLAELSATNMPDLILSDDGAAALKVEDPQTSRTAYQFVEAEDGLRSLVILLEQLVQRLAASAAAGGGPANTVASAFNLLSAHLGVKLVNADGATDLDITDPAPPPAAKAKV